MSWAAVAGAAVGVVGGVISSSASKSAANKQSASAGDAAAMQQAQFEQTRADQAPWRQAGASALSALQYRLGLGGDANGAVAPTNSLVGANFVDTSTGIPTANADLYASNPDYRAAWDEQEAAQRAQFGQGYAPDSSAARINAAITAKLQPQIQAQQSAQAASHAGDSTYGSLLRNFSMADYQADPGMQFRQDQGEKAINRAALASGRYTSGATLKALDTFNSGLASQEYGNAFNRYQTQQQNVFNRLSGLAGTGQQATNFTDALGANSAENSGNLLTSGAAASAAGTVGSANALTSGISSGLNYWQGQQAINALRTSRASTGYDPYDPYSVNSNSNGWT